MMTLLFIGIGILPSFAWLVFFLREDIRHPEPKRLIAETFLTGVLFTAVVLVLQMGVRAALGTFGVAAYGWLSLLLLAAIEEVAKFLAAYGVVRSHPREFDEPVDAMIYMITAGLGLAAVENVALVLQSASGALGEPGPIEIGALRFVGATLLHALTSAVVGYAWGRAAFRGLRVRRAIRRGLLLATALHAVFNYLILNYEPVTLPLLFLIFMAVFVLHDFEKLKQPVTTIHASKKIY